MDFQPIRLRRDLTVNTIYAVHYLELSQDHVFQGEQHDFWELVYVDRGEVIVTAGDQEFALTRGEMLFHAPNEWHALRGNGIRAANVMVLNFDCTFKYMDVFVGRRMRSLTDTQRELLRATLNQSRTAFSSRLDDPNENILVRAKDVPLGTEQLIGIYMMELLLSLYRQIEIHITESQKIGRAPMLDAIIGYMEQHLSDKLSLKQLSEEFHVSISYIQRLFSQYKQTGAIRYFTVLKIERAKQLLREKERNISQIAELLGYDNSHYFCNQFKKFTGKSPMEYRRSVSALAGWKKLI